MSGKLLAIDFGTKRTGFAITDDLQIIATALTTVPTHKVFEYINRDKISNLFSLEYLDNHYSKFLFNFINLKLFLENEVV